jgi:hypothetical protein
LAVEEEAVHFFDRHSRQPVERERDGRIRVAGDEPVAADVKHGGAGEAEVGAERAAGRGHEPPATGGVERHLGRQREARE